MLSTVTKCAEYKLLPSEGRKTISLRVTKNSSVIVHAPAHVSKEDVERFVSQRYGWIAEKQNYFNRLRALYPPKEFIDGESFPFLGRNLRLKILQDVNAETPKCAISSKRLNIYVNGQSGEKLKMIVPEIIQSLYAKHTASRAYAFARKHAAGLAIKIGRISVVEQKKRWGSCSRKGHIRINWRLSMMPSAVMEYIIVHELCHLKIPDHSAKFWGMVKSILPDYEKRRAWLRKHGFALFLISDWN